MESGGSMSHSQGLSNNPCSVLNQSIIRIDTYSFSKPGTSTGLYPVG